MTITESNINRCVFGIYNYLLKHLVVLQEDNNFSSILELKTKYIIFATLVVLYLGKRISQRVGNRYKFLMEFLL